MQSFLSSKTIVLWYNFFPFLHHLPSPCLPLVQKQPLSAQCLSPSLLSVQNLPLEHLYISHAYLFPCLFLSYEPPWCMLTMASCLLLFFKGPFLDHPKNYKSFVVHDIVGLPSTQEISRPFVEHPYILTPSPVRLRSHPAHCHLSRTHLMSLMLLKQPSQSPLVKLVDRSREGTILRLL